MEKLPVTRLLIDFNNKLVEINGKRFDNAVVVGLPEYMEDGTYPHRLLVNPEKADPMKKLPRIEVTFDPGSLMEK